MIELKHATEATAVEAGNGDIGKAEWNANHVLTGTAGALITFDASGNAVELSPPDGDLVGTDGTTTPQTLSSHNFRERDEVVTGDTPAIAGTGIRRWTLASDSADPDLSGMSDGDSVTFIVSNPSDYTMALTGVDKFLDNSPPSLSATADTIFVVFKSGGTVYCAANGQYW